MVDPASALPGRAQSLAVPLHHEVLGTPLQPPFADGVQTAIFGMGCFWGAERIFWQAPGVYSTAVGYAGGLTPNPSYEEVCSGHTGHAEVVLVAFRAALAPAANGAGVGDGTAVTTSYEELLRLFWEGHDPTQGMRQGNDSGTQYRSLILYNDEAQHAQAEASRVAYQQVLSASGHGPITTELLPSGAFYYAEDYHQQYLAKHPNGYCGLGGTGVSCPIGLTAAH
jgi:peptide-methionine (S)-S-oxide reductase